MTSPTASEVLLSAQAQRRGVVAMNVIQIEHCEAYVAAAEKLASPLIVQISENTAKYHGGLEPIAQAALAMARSATAPVLVHLDHATDANLVRQAVALGFDSVMFDAAALPYTENVALTQEITARCHEHGVWVEAELGEIGGKGGAHTPGVRTDPQEAADFVTATGVDALAVAVGSQHAMTERTASLDFDLISAIAARVSVPLVLHGSSGVADADIVRAITAGLTKINIATHLNRVMTAAIRDHLAAHPEAVDPRKYLGAGRAAIEAETVRLITALTAGPDAGAQTLATP